jgi:PAS domain S-box-containing protein
MSRRLAFDMEARLRLQLKAAVAGILLLACLLSVFSWRIVQQRAEDADWVARTIAVHASLELTLRHLDDVETGARGFSMTGQPAFMGPYDSGEYATLLDLETLRLLIIHSPDQEFRLRKLVDQAKNRIESARDLAAVRRSSGRPPTLAQIDQDKVIMDATRTTIQEMEVGENRLLAQRILSALRERQFTRYTIDFILGALLLSIAGVALRRKLSRTASARVQATAREADLELRVDQRTAGLRALAAAHQGTSEAKLRQADERRAFALKMAKLGDWELDLITLQANRSLLHDQIFGYSSIQPKWNIAIFLQHIHPDDRVAVDESFHNAARHETRWEFECRIICKDGEIRWIWACGDHYREVSAGAHKMYGIVKDVTERRQAMEALRESEERFQAMANGIPQLAWIAETDGSLSWFNRRWYEFTGTSFDQVHGWGWQSLVDPPFLPGVVQGWASAILAGDAFAMEYPMRGLVGPSRTFLTRALPVKDSAGNVIRWFGTNTDISERIAAEQQLTQQAEELERSAQALEVQKLMLQSVLNSMVEGLVAADEQGKFLLWNAAAEKIIGLPAADMPPENWSLHYGAYLPDMVTPFPSAQNPLLRAIHGEATSAVFYFRNHGLSQGVFVQSEGAPLRDKDGAVRGGVIAFRDITQKKTDDLEIRKLNEDLEGRIVTRTAELQAANQELEAFSYSISHDLRAPLRHISGFARILINDFAPSLTPVAKGHLDRIGEAVLRMDLMVDGLLSLATLGRQALQLQHCELNAIVDRVLLVLQPEWEGRKVEWHIAQLPQLECDPILMGQVFQNLISNALKYTRGQPTVVIQIDSTQQPGEPAIIFVRDNGAGFNMQYAEKLFGVFQRMHTESEFEGTGIGLATVQRIIQKHGGRVWAESEPSHGATFYFTLDEKARARG